MSGSYRRATARFAARVPGETEGHFVQELVGMIVVLDFDAVVSVIAGAVGNPNRVSAHAVIVSDNRKPWCRTPQDLTAQPQAAIGSRVRLPSVDDPGLDLQLLCREDLDPHAGEKPWRVRRYVRRLISPVIELIKAE